MARKVLTDDVINNKNTNKKLNKTIDINQEQTQEVELNNEDVDKFYSEVYHVTIDKNGLTDSSIVRLNNLDNKTKGDRLVYYYTDTTKIDSMLLNSRLQLLRKHFDNVIYGGVPTYTHNKNTGVNISYLTNILANRSSKHILVNMHFGLGYYSKLIKRLFGIDVVYLAENNDTTVLNFLYDPVVVNNILKLSNRYKKVVFIDADNMSITLSGSINKMIGNDDTLYVCVGLRGAISSSNVSASNINFKLKLNTKLLEVIEDRLVNLDLNLGTYANKNIQVIDELTDTIIMILCIYMYEKGKKIMVFSADKGYLGINKILGTTVLGEYFMFINRCCIDRGLLAGDFLRCIDTYLINNIHNFDRKQFIRDFNTWGLDGKKYYDDLILIKDSIDTLELNILS